MQRSNLIDIQTHRANPAPVRALLFGTTYGLSAFSEGRIGRMTGLSQRGKMLAAMLIDQSLVRNHPAPVRALLFGSTYGIASYTAGALVRLRGIEEIAARRRAVVLTSHPGRVPS